MHAIETLPPLASFWFRDAASTMAERVDWLYFLILWICVAFFVVIVGLMVAFIARYYARPGHREQHTPHHDNRLEAGWSIFPGLLVVAIFGYGFVDYLYLRTPPEDSYEVQVIAKKWNFSFQYPNGVIDANLHVPVDRNVKLVMRSEDVLHSLYIPAFRVKCDCVPGRYSTLWFRATKPTESFDEAIAANTTGSDENGYDLFCTEYCGQGHSSMIAKVVVHKSGEFEQWLIDADQIDPATSPVELGEKLWKDRGCKQCHSIDGKSGTGPSWLGTYGTEQKTNKGMVAIDKNYIRESILEPMAKIRDGYKGVMPSYQGQLKEAEIDALVYFIQSLKEGEAVPTTWEEIGGVPGQEPEEGAETAAPEADPAAEADAEADAEGETPAESAEADPQADA